jgi:hypothetical protein
LELPTWTYEQAASFAPDAQVRRAYRQCLAPAKWLEMGKAEAGIWGLFQGSGRNAYKVRIDIVEPAFRCSCLSKKQPCKHAIALFVRWTLHQKLFTETIPPDWMAKWLKDRAKKSQPSATVVTTIDREAQAERIEKRQKKIEAGMQALQLWLHDLGHNGLATVQNQPYSYWDNVAGRMVDAQAPAVAKMLREMAGGPLASSPNWSEKMLNKLSQLYLLTKAYDRHDQLSPSQQADLRMAVGWGYKQADLNDESAVFDEWFVVGQAETQEERLKVQRTWLWGKSTKKFALVMAFAHGLNPLPNELPLGKKRHGEVVFYPATVAMRGVMVAGDEAWGGFGEADCLSMASSVNSNLRQYSQVIAQNPWLSHFPFALVNVVPISHNQRWFVQDHDQRLPISPRFPDEWALSALSGGHPISLFGEWDGDTFLPLSGMVSGRWFNCRLGGQ